jgi:hypothetical protein
MTTTAIATAINTDPTQSTGGASAFTDGGTAHAVAATTPAAAPSAQQMPRQSETSSSTAEPSMPATPAHPATAAHNPTTRGRRWRGHACPISASVAGMTNAAPAPATMRHTTIGSGPSVNAGAIDAIANTLSPPSKAERRPYRSPMAPAGNSRHASATV